MMLIFSVIVIVIYSVCLVSAALKNAYFKKQFSVVASKWSLCDTENNTLEFKLCSMFKHSLNGKAMVYGTNGI